MKVPAPVPWSMSSFVFKPLPHVSRAAFQLSHCCRRCKSHAPLDLLRNLLLPRCLHLHVFFAHCSRVHLRFASKADQLTPGAGLGDPSSDRRCRVPDPLPW